MAAEKTRVVIVRGHQATPWELKPWELLPERFDVRLLTTRSNAFGLGGLRLESLQIRSVRDFVPGGHVADLAVHALGDRYLRLDERLAGADIVHAEELSYWFAAEAARAKGAGGFKLALTVWETLPLLESYRNPAARRHRRIVLEHADLFLAITERARASLLLEGVPDERVVVSPPGIETERFRASSTSSGEEHVVLSVGRLVWGKGHQDLIRALAVLRRGIVRAPERPVRLVLVGTGPERARLESYARELGVADAVEFREASYETMPALYAEGSCLVLASLPGAGCALGPSGLPRCFSDEQFGMVLAEAMAAGLPIIATTTGAIPEVLEGHGVLVAPGDWLGLAHALAENVLSRPPGTRVEHDSELVARYSCAAAAERLAAAYDRLTAAA